MEGPAQISPLDAPLAAVSTRVLGCRLGESHGGPDLGQSGWEGR